MRDQYGNLYFWVPIVGPLIGGLVGGALYRYGMTRFLPPPDEPEVNEPEDAATVRHIEHIARKEPEWLTSSAPSTRARPARAS